MPAIEQPRRHHVEGLKVLMHEAEGLLEMGQDGSGELVDQKGPIGVQHCPGLVENLISDAGLHRGIRNPRDHVVRATELQISEGRIGFGRRSMHDVQSSIPHSAPQISYEIAVRLHRHQHGVRAHAPENFGGECADSRTVLQKHSCPMPIYLSQEMIDQKTGARDQAAEHLGMLEKMAAEEQELLGSRRALDGHVQMLCLSGGGEPGRRRWGRRRWGATEVTRP